MGNRVISTTGGEKPLKDSETAVIHPGELILIESKEKVGFPPSLQGRICSKVTWLQKGLSSIATKIDPGYGYPEGWPLLLVFHHCGHQPISLSPGTPICSLEIEALTETAKKPYSGREPKTIVVSPIEAKDPLAKIVKPDFRNLCREDLENYYGHPLDDLFLAIGALQKEMTTIREELPSPRPLWQLSLVVYFCYSIAYVAILSFLCTWFGVHPATELILGSFFGIAGVVGVILGLWSRRERGVRH